MNILDVLIPQTMEMQRQRARQQFAAGLQQPQMFQTDQYPIAELAKAYEQGFGLPYPKAPVASPTAGLEGQGMTFDPNRQTTVEQPANLPLEYVKPRTPEDIAMRGAGIQGRAAGEMKLSELGQYGENAGRITGFFEDVGADPGEYDLPASLGNFERTPQAKPGDMPENWGPIQYDKYGHAYSVEQNTNEPKGLWGAPGEGGGGGSETPEDKQYKLALDTYKALNQRLDPITAQLLTQLGAAGLQNPEVQDRIKGTLTPNEQRQLELALQYMDWYQRRRNTGAIGPNQDPLGIR